MGRPLGWGKLVSKLCKDHCGKKDSHPLCFVRSYGAVRGCQEERGGVLPYVRKKPPLHGQRSGTGLVREQRAPLGGVGQSPTHAARMQGAFQLRRGGAELH